MSGLPRVLHLVDDTTAGGVMRVLDFICTDAAMAKTAEHRVQSVQRGKFMGRLAEADVIVSHLTVSWRSLPALIALRLGHPRTPLLHVEHSYTEHFVVHNVAHRRRFKALLRSAFALFDQTICVSEGQAAWMRKAGLVRTEKLAVIQSCVDLQAFRNLPPPAGPTRVFGAIGRLDKQKGFDVLIKAFRQCTDSNISLHVIGTGAEEQTLRALAEGDTRIIFKGFQADTTKALSAVDTVIMPSRWEAYGLVAIEALAAGRQLICHDIDGMRDHAALGASLIQPSSDKDLGDQIVAAARSNIGQSEPIIQGDVQHLENRFRDAWKSILTPLS